MSFIGPLLTKLFAFYNSSSLSELIGELAFRNNLRGPYYDRRSLMQNEMDYGYMAKQEERAELYYRNQLDERDRIKMQGDYLHINANFPCIAGGYPIARSSLRE